MSGVKAAGRCDAGNRVRRAKRVGLAAIFLAMAGAFGGCSLAREEVSPQGEDRLVGIFMTREYPDLGFPEIEIDRKGEVSLREESARLYGRIQWEEDEDAGPSGILFEGLEGEGIYHLERWNEELQFHTDYLFQNQDTVFQDGFYSAGDGEDSVEITVYVEATGERASFYVNPVYQTPEGEIYLQQGNGLTAEITEGSSMSHTVSWERKVRQDGEERKEKMVFTMHIVGRGRENLARLVFMDEQDQMIQEMPGEQVETLAAEGQGGLRIPEGTAYLLMEQEDGDGNVTRTLYNRGQETLDYLRPTGTGYLVREYLTLMWE